MTRLMAAVAWDMRLHDATWLSVSLMVYDCLSDQGRMCLCARVCGCARARVCVQVGPRFCLNPVRIFDGSFGGRTLYENPEYVSPNAVSHRVAVTHAHTHAYACGMGPGYLQYKRMHGLRAEPRQHTTCTQLKMPQSGWLGADGDFDSTCIVLCMCLCVCVCVCTGACCRQEAGCWQVQVPGAGQRRQEGALG